MKAIVLILILIFLLRIPSFFEPYWYGDEGIYLAIGQALQRGSVLYRDIWDNKTPLIYLIYAINPVLWWVKLAAAISVLGSLVGIYLIAKRVNKKLSFLTTLIAGIFLSIPLFEGTIANAELFFILPIVWGAYFITGVRGVRNDFGKLVLIGFLAGIAFLIKVPAIFDFIGMFLFLAVYLFELLWNRKKITVIVKAYLETYLAILTGAVIPVILVLIYFSINNALYDFFGAAFLNNATYVSVGSGPFSSFTNPLFVKGIILVCVSACLIFCYLKKIVSKEFLFLSLWFSFSLFGALLSNRPYMHYLLQVIPSAALLISYVIVNFKKYFVFAIPLVLIYIVLQGQFRQAFRLHTVPYYKNFYDFASERKTWEEYVSFFDRNAIKTYKVSGFIATNTNPNDTIFVWDDASNLYVLSERKPATRFVQAHHLTLVDKRNYEIIASKITQLKPEMILVSPTSRFKFEQLNDILEKYYEEENMIEGFIVYKPR